MSQEESRGEWYKFLSDCYYLPDAKLLDTVYNGNEGARDLCAGTANFLDDVVTLQVDYARLFVGPYGLLAPPYGSIYLDNSSTIVGDSTLDVQRRYAEEGLCVDIKEVPDHIAIELEFMYFLIFKEAEANINSDTHRAAGYRKKQEVFLKTHLGRWVTDFAGKVESNAQTDFYKSLARSTKSFIQTDIEFLSSKFGVALS